MTRGFTTNSYQSHKKIRALFIVSRRHLAARGGSCNPRRNAAQERRLTENGKRALLFSEAFCVLRDGLGLRLWERDFDPGGGLVEHDARGGHACGQQTGLATLEGENCFAVVVRIA